MAALIGEVARRAGVSAAPIRYGLHAPARSPTGYCRYAASTVEELRFIGNPTDARIPRDEAVIVDEVLPNGHRVAPCR